MGEYCLTVVISNLFVYASGLQKLQISQCVLYIYFLVWKQEAFRLQSFKSLTTSKRNC